MTSATAWYSGADLRLAVLTHEPQSLVLPRFGNLRRRVALPCPRNVHAAEEPLDERAKRKLAVIAVRQDHYARLPTREAQ